MPSDLLTHEQALRILTGAIAEAIRKKIQRLGLEVVNLKGYRTTTLKLPHF